VSLPRFFAPDADRTGAVIALPDDEAAHLARVLRLTPGAAVRVFDGRGREWRGEVNEVARRGVTVRLGETVAAAREPRVAVTLVLAVLKSDKMDQVVRDAVMLGVTAIRPLVTERTEVTRGVIERSGRMDRWQRIAVASVKQCGRALVPPVLEPLSFADALQLKASGVRIMLVEPSADSTRVDTLREVPPSSNLELWIGPEGGWTADELQTALAAGSRLVRLGEQTLRADAVPVVALTALRALWDDL